MKQRFSIAKIFLRTFAFTTLCVVAGTTVLAQSEIVFSEPQPVTLLNSAQYDLTSTITGRYYRLFLSAPDSSGDGTQKHFTEFNPEYRITNQRNFLIENRMKKMAMTMAIFVD
jgi:hypothetical protein